MPFVTPKTTWTGVPTEYFNLEDYSRITGNIAYLRDLAHQLYAPFATAPMSTIDNYNCYIYAEDINAIEDNLDAICAGTFPFPIGDKKRYSANNRTIDYAELNRIEAATVTIYNNLTGQLAGKRRLSFVLGGMRL